MKKYARIGKTGQPELQFIDVVTEQNSTFKQEIRQINDKFDRIGEKLDDFTTLRTNFNQDQIAASDFRPPTMIQPAQFAHFYRPNERSTQNNYGGFDYNRQGFRQPAQFQRNEQRICNYCGQLGHDNKYWKLRKQSLFCDHCRIAGHTLHNKENLKL